ncbi:hypothetical protein TRIP_B50383 [uncultured Desulfatiglans sp.]|uniref:Uncharacterized protein n=1 Tax=Uncultured Desulfatiglans sp. TaxID=1748965 RepID=A0A653AHT2_UNCDX|nr:hypothetical protein TRIP_B50383 [uncultured Desulfatiglans sp.]
MVFLAILGVILHVCLWGDLQVAFGQTVDFLDFGQKPSFSDGYHLSRGICCLDMVAFHRKTIGNT